VFVLTSYEDDKEKTVSPIYIVGADAKSGMKNCAEETRKFARTQDSNPQPQNTRSNPADRIRRFRVGIGTTRMSTEEQEAVRVSEFYRKSMKFLLQCVLSPLYGEKVGIVALDADELNREKRFPGRRYFVEAVLRALDMGDRNILTLRNRDGNIIGLLSSAGPIPVVDNVFSLPELRIDETKDLGTILGGLPKQDKEVLAYWLKIASTAGNASSSLLYADLIEKLKQENIDISREFREVEATIQVGKTSYGPSGFPVLKEYGEAILCDRITVVSMRDKTAPFGYSMKPLSFEADGLPYVFLPPLSMEAIAATSKSDDFVINEIEIPEGIKDSSAPKELRVPLDMEANKLVSVTIRCKVKIKHLDLVVRRTYSGGEIRYIRNFPSLTIYGPVPMHGWIARRNIDLGEFPSPLEKGAVENITLKDISFEEETIEAKDGNPVVINKSLDFVPTADNYSIYQGPIPLWLAVKTSTGDILGGLPLRVVPVDDQGNWINKPNFIHTENPKGNGRLIVAADIGSSRSAFLFLRSNESEGNEKEIFIDHEQPLGIPITTSGTTDVDVNFGMMLFQPEKQLGKVEGKTPIGLLTTDDFQSGTKDSVMLFNSGKLILLDPKSIADASTRKILSDIKVGNDQKAMYLLAQSLLAMIIDRAIHMGCSTVELRVSYLVERYSSFESAWKSAIKKYKELWPGITVELNMFLPESLAIANELKTGGTMTATSGAAIVDIGDFTTDIALFTSENKSMSLKNNFSVQFAGRQIILQPIWDYLLFSGAKIESLYNPDLMKSNDCKQAVARLQAAREKQKKEKKRLLSDDVRRDLLCLMGNLNIQNIPLSLRNLFDICYLTEIVILKRILRNEPRGDGNFDIHLFGGGRSLIRVKDTGFNWDEAMGRTCNAKLPGQEGKALAQGLLRKIHPTLEDEAAAVKKRATNYNPDRLDDSQSYVKPSHDELRKAYICFLQNAQAVKRWEVLDSNDNLVSTGRLFNVKKSGMNSDGEIDDEGLFREVYDVALEYAMAGTVYDVEIVKTLFAYKVAYDSAVAFYSRT